MLNAFDNFVDDEVYEGRLQSCFIFLNQVQKVLLKVLENQVNLSLLFKSLTEIDHEVAFQHFEHPNLSLDGFPGKLILVTFLELLYCHSLVLSLPKCWFSRLTAFQTIPYAPSSMTSKISYFYINKYNFQSEANQIQIFYRWGPIKLFCWVMVWRRQMMKYVMKGCGII